MSTARHYQIGTPKVRPLEPELVAQVKDLYLTHGLSVGAIAAELELKQSQVIDALKLAARESEEGLPCQR